MHQSGYTVHVCVHVLYQQMGGSHNFAAELHGTTVARCQPSNYVSLVVGRIVHAAVFFPFVHSSTHIIHTFWYVAPKTWFAQHPELCSSSSYYNWRIIARLPFFIRLQLYEGNGRRRYADGLQITSAHADARMHVTHVHEKHTDTVLPASQITNQTSNCQIRLWPVIRSGGLRVVLCTNLEQLGWSAQLQKLSGARSRWCRSSSVSL